VSGVKKPLSPEGEVEIKIKREKIKVIVRILRVFRVLRVF